MKIILSHDVDHLTAWEHLARDTILPRFVLRAQIELLLGKITPKEYLLRLLSLFHNRWNNVEALMAFEQARKLHSSWFVGMSNGLGLSYSLSRAMPVIRRLIGSGFEVGVHGIEFADFEKVAREHDAFARISGRSRFGIRMHYLRFNDDTPRHLAGAGYAYDATRSGLENPSYLGSLPEFPLHIMDVWILSGQKRWQARNLEQAQQETLAQIKAAHARQLKYLTILFHDCYFSDAFATWKNWYTWLVDYLLEQGHEFLTYEQALTEL